MSRDARARRHAGKRGAGQRAALSAGSGGGAATVLGALARTGAGRAGSDRHAGRKTAPRTVSGGASRPALPIVTTITRIVGVVPTLLWVAIVALAALVLGLAVRTRLAALRAGRLERQRRELLADVGLLQAALLPAPPGRLGPVGTSVAYRPADGPGAGGDFYDVFGLGNGSLGVIVGDVSGHGRSALPHTALVRYTLRAYLEAWLSPREAVQTAGSVLDRQLGGSFVTVVAAVYHPRERTLTYASAGHPPPIVLGAECLQPVTAAAAPPLGTGMRTGTRQTVVSVPGGAQLCFYTDGVTEARVGGGELYGSDRLTAALGGLGARATAVALLDRVAAETRLRPDDMAACLLSVAGEACAPRALVEEIELDRETAAGERTERFLFACGVLPEEVASLTRAAAALTQRSGSVLLDVRFDAGATPQVALRHDNLAPLHRRPSVARPARAGVS